jgi:hypothetical protein
MCCRQHAERILWHCNCGMRRTTSLGDLEEIEKIAVKSLRPFNDLYFY